jgi:lipopolysaccharide transport system ATP-binding protein
MAAAVCFEHVSKRFILHHERPRSFQEWAIQTIQRRANMREPFWALRDVSFTVELGEMLGIIGENGAGKSTILKLISRILEPTSGRVAVQGRVSALIELGAGFHPDLTGRENIYLNGSILGLSKREMDRQFAAIVDFAELERFIDTPVKHYSSGMYARLGFAVAIHVHPDVLLIDEVLAVGDEAFQKKCLERIAAIKAQGKTIILVTHNLDAVDALCDHVLWLDEGVVRAQGAGSITSRYRRYMAGVVEAHRPQPAEPEAVAESAAPRTGGRCVGPAGSIESTSPGRWGSYGAEIVNVEFLDAQSRVVSTLRTGEPLVVRIQYQAHSRIERPVFGLAIYREDPSGSSPSGRSHVQVNGPNTKLAGYDIAAIEGRGSVNYVVDALPLLPGSYQLSVAIYDYTCLHAYDHHHLRYPFVVEEGAVPEGYGLVYIPARWEHRLAGGREQEA